MERKLQDLIDIPRCQKLLDSLHRAFDCPSAIIDIQGTILTASGWQDICTRFHRVNPEAAALCLKSDRSVLERTGAEQSEAIYQCPHGLLDVAIPIRIGHIHMGNLFIGQFLLEPPDREAFRAQARRYGFDEKAYMEALDRVPILTREQLSLNLAFVRNFAEILADSGSRQLKELEREKYFRAIYDSVNDAVSIHDGSTGQILDVNLSACALFGFSRAEMLGHTVESLSAGEPPFTQREAMEWMRKTSGEGPQVFDWVARHSSGRLFWVEVSMSQVRMGEQDYILASVRDISTRKESEAVLARRTYDLRERVKEFNCLVGTYRLVHNPALSLEEIFQRAVHLLPPAYQYPELTRARITAEGQTYLTGPFPPDGWLQGADIILHGRRVGTVEVCYTCPTPPEAEGPFLAEERALLDSLAEGFSLAIERHRSLEALRLANAYNRSLVESNLDPMVTISPDGLITDANLAAETITGFSREEMVGAEILDFFASPHPKESVLRRIFLEGWVKDLELNILHRDGHQTPVLCSASLYRNEMGETEGIVATARDITSLRQVEEIGRKESERTHALLDLYSRAPELADRELYAFALDQAVNLTGSRIGFFHRVADDNRTILLTMWNHEALKNCKAGGDDHYPIEKAGNWVDCLKTRQPVIYNDYPTSPNQKGLPQGHVTIQRFMSIPVFDEDKARLIFGVGNKTLPYDDADVRMVQIIAEALHRMLTQRRTAAALQQSQAELNATFTNAPTILCLLDSSLCVRRLNRAGLALAGWAEEDIPGKTLGEALRCGNSPDRCGASSGCAICTLRRVLSETLRDGRERQRVEVKTVLASGHVPHALTLLASTTRLEVSGEAMVLLCLEDITEQRRAEEARAQLEEQLRQSQKLEAIGTLAGGIAHDFNNILAAIIGFAELVKADVQDRPESLEAMESIVRGSERARDLVRQILTFSRHVEQERRPLSLGPVVKEALKMLRSTIPATIEITPEIGDPLPRILADPTKIQQVLMNLCTNAAYAMKDRPGRLDVTLRTFQVEAGTPPPHPDLHEGKWLHLSVRDSGCGMDQEVRERIFEPFFSTKPRGEGTGLGLSVVHGIVKEHEGAISVKSEPGEGTVFHLFFPALDYETREEEESPSRISRGNNERILVVDDDEALGRMTERALVHLGYRPTVFQDPRKALETFLSGPEEFDLVITDLTMPNMTGVDLAQSILAARPGLPVLLATGYSVNWTRESVRQIGLRDVLYKPNNIATLSQAIHEALHS